MTEYQARRLYEYLQEMLYQYNEVHPFDDKILIRLVKKLKRAIYAQELRGGDL